MPQQFHSELPIGKYREELRSCLGWKLPVMGDCLNGILIGNFFSIAYYSPYEWNRKITCECNRAIGFLKEADGGTQVCFVRSKGLLSPMWLCLFLIFWSILGCAAYGAAKGVGTGVLFTAAICGISALQSSLTQEGERGMTVIDMVLEDPEHFYYC